MKRNILGLDLGTNSIGWALIQKKIENREGKILGMGSRIIPMDTREMGKFAEGASISKTAERTGYRGTRRLRERHLLRRERLHRVLHVLGFLPEHYAKEIHFKDEVIDGKRIKKYGQYRNETEPKLAWKKNGKKENEKDRFEFIFQDLFEEMIADFKQAQPELLNRTNRNGEPAKIPYDWTIYYLRKKALEKTITKEQLAWLILNFNQKRGYYQLRGEEEEENPNKLVEFHSLKVVDVKANKKYTLTMENGEVYTHSSEIPLFDWEDTNRDFIVTTYLEKDGTAKKDKNGKEKQSFVLKEDLGFIKRKKTKTSKNKNNVKVEEQALKVIDVKEEKQDEIWYSLELENGWVYKRKSKTPLFDWKDKVREFIVTMDLNDDQTVKTDAEGNEKRSFRAPKEDDWTLVKKKTENDLENYISDFEKNNGIKGTVGAYIYDTLLENPTQKIRGKLVRTIERKFYKDELRLILKKQIGLQPELFSDDLYNDCVRELYRSNEAHQQSLSKRDFVHLFLDDIIFYQRPLRSQKSSIGNCSLEFHKYKDKDGKEVTAYLKAIPKSNPYYQEFRVWQWLYNLKIFTKSQDKDATAQFIKGTEDIENLFAFLMSKKEVNHKDILEYFITPVLKEKFPNVKAKVFKDELNKEIAKYRWNYVFDDSKVKEDEKSKKYPMNETGYDIKKQLGKVENVPENFLTREVEQQLWHIIYSVTDKKEYEKALKRFAQKNRMDTDSFVENFTKIKPYPSDFGRYSEKAIKKLLPLMRIGKYWDWNNIDSKTKERIDKILTGEYDQEMKNQVREKAIHLTKNEDFQGLQLWLAQYIVYDRHSEAFDINTWTLSHEIDIYLNKFKQHSLRNHIVEQVVNETLRVVKDIWEHFAEKENLQVFKVYDEKKNKHVKSYPRIFDEIHIELGREMKNPAEERQRITKQVSDNENTNLRIKAMLMEFSNDDSFKNQRDYENEKGGSSVYLKKGNNPVRPYSPMQQDILKIYEDGVLSKYSEQDLKDQTFENTSKNEAKNVYEVSTKAQPTKSEILRYKLWLEQKYRSPYTGQIIPLTKLFTTAYEIEHIIPQSRYFDNSFSNKVICESEVNKLKDNQLGFEFIKNCYGQKVAIENGTKTVEIFTEEAYKTFVKEHYDKNRGKKNKLLLEEIPDKMIARQLNDTRYISKFISQVLSNIVRVDEEKAKQIIADAEILANNEPDKKEAEKIREKAKSAAYDDGVNSKNIVLGNGKITGRLKHDWGLNNVWNGLILPRFERMNKLTQTTAFTSINKEGHIIPTIPLELSKGFQKKRIDHRHHALDALVVACTTSEHVQYLNNENTKSQKFHLQRALAKKLRKFEKVQKPVFEKDENNVWRIKVDENGNQITKEIEVPKAYLMPWENFTADAKNELEKIIVSFKQNIRVINKATNHYEKIKNGKKVKVEQKGMNWAIRKSLHTPMPYGKRAYDFDLLKIADNVGKREYIIDDKIKAKVEDALQQHHSKVTATEKFLKKNPIKDENGNEIISTAFKLKPEKFRKRQSITQLSNRGQGGIKTVEDAIKYIDKVADFIIRKDLLKHLKECGNELEKAFSAEGIENFNSKRKIPVYKLPIAESGSGRFAVGNRIGTKHKWVEADKGTNLFFAVYERMDNKERMFDTVPLNEVIEHQKLQEIQKIEKIARTLIPIKKVLIHNNKEVIVNYLFHISPNDLVYVPTEEERENINGIDFNNLTKEQTRRVYKMVSSTGGECHFVPVTYSAPIKNNECGSNNKNERMIQYFNNDDLLEKNKKEEGKPLMIKKYCIKLKVNRLGNISKVNL